MSRSLRRPLPTVSLLFASTLVLFASAAMSVIESFVHPTPRLSTVTRKFANVFRLRGIISDKQGFVQFLQQRHEVVSSEGPVERRRDAFEVALELVQTFSDVIEVAEVVRCEDLPLDDGEVDLDLVQPARMNGRVNRYEARMLLLQPCYRACPAV